MADGQLAGAEEFLRGKPCPKCAYVRGAGDTNPISQCPYCGIIYLKYRPPSPQLHARLAERRRVRADVVVDDRSTWSLIGANLLGVVIALISGMTLRDLMLVYWLQSVIIGVSYLVRMAKAHDFDLFRPALLFMSYGVFHAFYFFFLTSGNQRDGTALAAEALAGLLLCGLVFAGHEIYSTAGKLARDRLTRPGLGDLGQACLLRVVPMHLAIIFSDVHGSGVVSWLLFVGLKIVADVTMHVFELRLGQRPR